MLNPDLRGRFVWHELMTTDPAAAQAFYSSVVGWGTHLWEGGEEPYRLWTIGEGAVAGVMRLPEVAAATGARPHWLPYIGTPDVDGTAARASALGATVLVRPMDIPAVGRFAVLDDPQGAVFAVFTPSGDETGAEEAGVGEFAWHELATTDQQAAFSFYSDLFGWEETDTFDMGPMGLYRMYGRGGQTLGGMFDRSAQLPGPPAWLCYVTVDDVDRAAGRVRSLGGTVVNGPMEVPGGDRVAQCLDPQGTPFAVHRPGA